MSKTILLELTEKEAELLGQAIIRERFFWEEKKEISRTLREKNDEICVSLWAKLDEARQPKEEILITYKDINHLIYLSGNQYRELPSDLHISGKRVEQNYLRYICLANALIVWLNGHKLLKRLAVFDYTDMSGQYEESEE